MFAFCHLPFTLIDLLNQTKISHCSRKISGRIQRNVLILNGCFEHLHPERALRIHKMFVFIFKFLNAPVCICMYKFSLVLSLSLSRLNSLLYAYAPNHLFYDAKLSWCVFFLLLLSSLKLCWIFSSLFCFRVGLCYSIPSLSTECSIGIGISSPKWCKIRHTMTNEIA